MGCSATGWVTLEYFIGRQGDTLMQMVVRLFLEVTDASEAETITYGIEHHLQSFATMTKELVRPYWKIHEFTEVLLVFDLQISGEDVIYTLMNYLADGWFTVSEHEVLWTVEGGSRARIPALRWGHIEIHN